MGQGSYSPHNGRRRQNVVADVATALIDISYWLGGNIKSSSRSTDKTRDEPASGWPSALIAPRDHIRVALGGAPKMTTRSRDGRAAWVSGSGSQFQMAC